MEKCANCGDVIGDLETPSVFRDKVVCSRCYGKLTTKRSTIPATVHRDDSKLPPAAVATAVPLAYGTPSSPPPIQAFAGQNEIICPNPHCGYRGPARIVPKGSTGLGCLLMLLMIVPGVIYLIIFKGNHYVCPRCGLRIRSD